MIRWLITVIVMLTGFGYTLIDDNMCLEIQIMLDSYGEPINRQKDVVITLKYPLEETGIA